MIDGKKLPSKNLQENLEQNRDYNGWKGTTNRNLIIVWDTFGKIVDVGVNLPGNFHDSKSTLWCAIYEHIANLPDGYIVVCDSAFTTSGNLTGKLCKLKEVDSTDIRVPKTEYKQLLTHL